MEIRFYHGICGESYEKQANAQGFTLGEKADFFEKIRHACNFLGINGYLTSSQADSVCRKIQNNLVKELKSLSDAKAWTEHFMSRFGKIE